MKTSIILIVILSFLITPLNSQIDSPQSSPFSKKKNTNLLPPELKGKASKFFNELMDSNVISAYNHLFESSYISQKTNKVNKLINSTHKAIEQYGNLKGYEAVNHEIVSPSYIRLRYLGLHSRFPLRWIFTFYNSPDNGWIITNVKFDDYSEEFFTD